MEAFWSFLAELGFVGWAILMIIAVVAIEGVVKIVKMLIKHTERMAMIHQGIDPDQPEDGYKRDKV